MSTNGWTYTVVQVHDRVFHIDPYGRQAIFVIVLLAIALAVIGFVALHGGTPGDDDGTWGEGRTAPSAPPRKPFDQDQH